MRSPTPEELAIVDAEEALLARVRACLDDVERARLAASEGDARRTATELRDAAAEAHADDLPALFAQLHQVRAVAERRRVGSVPDRACPYFAHLRLREGDSVRDYLLGQIPLLDAASGIRIIDWRHAPIAQIFYRYREGDPVEEELPGRKLDGVLEWRRVVTIVDGKLRMIVTPAATLVRDSASGEWGVADEEVSLGGGEGTAERGLLGTGAGRDDRVAPNIAALLDPVQFDILHAHASDPMLLVGIAGSGKTTLALHRLAVLRHDDPARFAPSRLGVVVPEAGVARLARRLLAPLGLAETSVHTFEKWAHAELARLGLRIKLSEETPTAVARLKRHPALLAALPDWVAKQLAHHRSKAPEEPVDVLALRYWLLGDRALLGEVAARAGLSSSVVDETARRTVRQADERTEARFRGTDAARLATLDGKSLDSGSDEDLAGTLDEEDLAILLELLRLTSAPRLAKRTHLVVDEAQELAAIELRGLGQGLASPASFTVAGDDLQRTGVDAEFGGWSSALTELGAPQAVRRELGVGYRCPLPIAELAEQVLGPLSAGRAPSGRPGSPVGRHRFPHLAAQSLFLSDAIGELLDREPRASLALLVRDPRTAERWAAQLAHLARVRLVCDGEFSFSPGVDICLVTDAKGLEFDYVIIPDGDAVTYPVTNESRRLLYVAITRATHQLWVCSVGTPSLLLAPAGAAFT